MGSSETPLHFISNTKGIQWGDTDASQATPIHTKGPLQLLD